MTQHLDATYLTVARWVQEYGRMEIGQDEFSRSFIRALDDGGMAWEGQEPTPPLMTPCRIWRLAWQRGCERRGCEPMTGPLRLAA
jgi:hypothetical protein